MADIQVLAINCVHDNIGGNFEMLDEVDPRTGQFKIRALPRVTNPGDWALFPDDMARELLASGVVRIPTEDEIALRRLAGGADV